MNFDRIAPIYRWMERLAAGGKLQRCRIAFLHEIPPPRRILLAGEGHGRFLHACRRAFPDATIVVLDASRRMLEIARRQATDRDVEFVHANLLDWPPPDARFDLVVTHFFLDCFTLPELSLAVEKLGLAATPDATWLLADFQLAPSGLARLRSRLILALLYRFFHVTSGLEATELVSPDPALARAGFRRSGRRVFEWGLLKSECWTRKASDAGPCSRRIAGL